MAILTDEQLNEIRDIIQRHHAAVIAGVFGPESVSPAERNALEAAGMFDPDLRTLNDSYLLGHSMAMQETGTARRRW